MNMDLIDTLPEHWRYISEGGATIVFSYVGPPHPRFDGRVLRLRKAPIAASPPTHLAESDQLGIMDEPDDPMIEYQRKCMQRIVPPTLLPDLETVHLDQAWLDALIATHDVERALDRRKKDQIDSGRRKGVLATDLVGGDWLAVEIKPKWAFLPQATHLSDATRLIKTRTCRYCMHSRLRTTQGEVVSVGYCPLDLFSGDPIRIRKAISDLWDGWFASGGTTNSLKLFSRGKMVHPSDAFQVLRPGSEQPDVVALKDAFSEALFRMVSESPALQIISNLQRNLDPLDIEGLSKLWSLAQATSSLSEASPTHPTTPIGVDPKALFIAEPTISDWVAFLDTFLSSDTTLNHQNPSPDHLRHYLLAYLLSATFKDCSIIFRLDFLDVGSSQPSRTEPKVTIIDLDPKGLGRLRKWEVQDREIALGYGESAAPRDCVDAWAR